MSAAVTPHDFPEIGWQGHWIWVLIGWYQPAGT